MKSLPAPLRVLPDELGDFLRRALFAVLIGLLVGAVGVAFHYGIDLATELRQEHHWLLFLLPLGGLAIVLLYQVCGMEKDQGTNLVLVAVREHEPMRLRTAPLFFPPIVDDPYLFGQIAAANAISDVYAMGGEPKLALNVMCVSPQMDREAVHGVLRGG